jgi:hypothetical protein
MLDYGASHWAEIGWDPTVWPCDSRPTALPNKEAVPRSCQVCATVNWCPRRLACPEATATS